jgi:hypothetical protein
VNFLKYPRDPVLWGLSFWEELALFFSLSACWASDSLKLTNSSQYCCWFGKYYQFGLVSFISCPLYKSPFQFLNELHMINIARFVATCSELLGIEILFFQLIPTYFLKLSLEPPSNSIPGTWWECYSLLSPHRWTCMASIGSPSSWSSLIRVLGHLGGSSLTPTAWFWSRFTDIWSYLVPRANNKI